MFSSGQGAPLSSSSRLPPARDWGLHRVFVYTKGNETIPYLTALIIGLYASFLQTHGMFPFVAVESLFFDPIK